MNNINNYFIVGQTIINNAKLVYRKKLKLATVALLSLTGLIYSSSSFAYERVHVTNYSTMGGLVTVHYVDHHLCSKDKFRIAGAKAVKNGIQPAHAWPGSKRGACLVEKVGFHPDDRSKITEVDGYRSSGTAYHEFSIMVRSPSRVRIMSDHEVKAEKRNKETEKMSPGFKIHNKTHLNLTVSLDQLGCLYYQDLKPGETFDRTTGAVWFTIRAKVKSPKNELSTVKCALPVALTVGRFMVMALNPATAGISLEKFIATQVATQITQEELAKLNKAMSATLFGQYAGPPYPFRCTHKPEYNITGGPKMEITYTPLTAKEKSEKKARLKELKYNLASYPKKYQPNPFDPGYYVLSPKLISEWQDEVSYISTLLEKGNINIKTTAEPLKIHKINGCK